MWSPTTGEGGVVEEEPLKETAMAQPERWEGLRVGVASGNPRCTCTSSETLPSPARASDFA